MSVLGALGTGSSLAVRLPSSTAMVTLRGGARVLLGPRDCGHPQLRQGRRGLEPRQRDPARKQASVSPGLSRVCLVLELMNLPRVRGALARAVASVCEGGR